jgi:hypothetical protein
MTSMVRWRKILGTVVADVAVHVMHNRRRWPARHRVPIDLGTAKEAPMRPWPVGANELGLVTGARG